MARGAALVEVVVALPILVVLLVGTADFARVFYAAIELTNAARAGAQFGAKSLGAGVVPGPVEAMATSSINLTPSPTARARQRCECALPNATFNLIDCLVDPATACPSAAGKFRVVTITVTTSMSFSTIAPYPGIPRPLQLTRVAIMRVTE